MYNSTVVENISAFVNKIITNLSSLEFSSESERYLPFSKKKEGVLAPNLRFASLAFDSIMLLYFGRIFCQVEEKRPVVIKNANQRRLHLLKD